MTDRFKEVADSLNKYKPHLSGMGGSIGTAELGVFTRNHINILTEALYLAQDNEDSAVRYYKVCLELAEKRIESEQLRKENEELKAKLEKAKVALRFYGGCGRIFKEEINQNQRARKTLEEI